MSPSPERARDQWPVLALWFVVTTGVFYFCVEDDQLDDLAGWIPVVIVLQLPAFPAAAFRALHPAAPLPAGRAVAFAISLAIATAYTCFLLFTLVGSWIWKPRFFELRPVFLGFCMGVIALVTMLVRGLGRLRKLPHPDAARRSLLELLGGNAVLWLVLASGAGTMILNAAAWFLIVLPLFWMAPLWLLLPRRPAVPGAVIRYASQRGPLAAQM